MNSKIKETVLFLKNLPIQKEAFCNKIGGLSNTFPDNNTKCNICNSFMYLLVSLQYEPLNKQRFFVFACNTNKCFSARVFRLNKEFKEELNMNKTFPSFDSFSLICETEVLSKKKEILCFNIEKEDVLKEETFLQCDKVLNKFEERVTNYPTQCVRISPHPLFYVEPDPTGKRKLNKKTKEEFVNDKIPKCKECKSKKKFYFQVMPSILTYLQTEKEEYLMHIKKKDRSLDPFSSNGMEWGTIFIYACSNMCNDKTFLEEHCFIQRET